MTDINYARRLTDAALAHRLTKIADGTLKLTAAERSDLLCEAASRLTERLSR